jgi:hypothetical protein
VKEVNMKDGFTLSELEQFSKRHKTTILFSAIFLLSAVFALIWGYGAMSIWLLGLGGIAGVCFPKHIGNFLIKCGRGASNQEKIVRMIFAGVALVLAILFPPVHFLIAGLICGVTLQYRSDVFHSSKIENKKEEKKSEEK